MKFSLIRVMVEDCGVDETILSNVGTKGETCRLDDNIPCNTTQKTLV